MKNEFDRETYDASIPNFGRVFFPSRRGGQLFKGTAVQRRGRDHAVVVIARREVSVVKIFRVLDDICDLFLLL
jgi:hypothetical protein